MSSKKNLSPLLQQKSSMKPYTSNFKTFPTFSYQLPKIDLHSHNKMSLMKPDTFDFKRSLLPAKTIPSPPSYHSSRLLLNRKTQKTVFV